MYQNLSDKELLKILVAERIGECVTENLLTVFPSLPHALIDSTEEELLQIRGIGKRRVSQLKACYELARRLYTSPVAKGKNIKSPQDVADMMLLDMKFLRVEVFKILILNTKGRLIDIKQISEGCLNSAIVHPREVYRPAIQLSGASIVAVHNHPSSDVTPSQEDIDTTWRLIDAGNTIGIKLYDHLIIGGNGYFSMKEQGLFSF